MVKKNAAIIGIGNILMGDDGVGVMVIRELSNGDITKNATLIEGGTDFSLILDTLMTYEYITIVDALNLGNTPGSIYYVSFENVLKWDETPGLSLHDINPVSILKYAHSIGAKPKGYILGIEPKDMNPKIGLSLVVKNAIPRVITHLYTLNLKSITSPSLTT